MELSVNTLVSRFKAFAGTDGSSDTLSRDEFCRLISSELPNFVKNAGDPAAIDQLMSSLDKNNDEELNFLGFWQLIGQLASEHGEF